MIASNEMDSFITLSEYIGLVHQHQHTYTVPPLDVIALIHSYYWWDVCYRLD
jgi:hypothetical protein